MHAGPVVAGVVGQERYQFDIWGDTVNVAARMVGMSSPGSVAATKDIFDKFASSFDGEALGSWISRAKARSPCSASAPAAPEQSPVRPAKGPFSPHFRTAEIWKMPLSAGQDGN